MRKPLVLLVAACLSGCAVTGRAPSAQKSGFLKDYTLLRTTKGDRAQLLFVSNQTDWGRYDKIIIEPVSIWRVPGSKLEDLPENELNDLGRYFHTAIKKELAKDYRIVDEPSVGTMRFRLALTEARKSHVTMDMITSVLPVGLGVSVVQKLAMGTHSFVGKATVEVELKSATTGEILAAAVASRVGGKTFDTGKLSSWSDVRAAADHWAERLRVQLAKARAGESLVED
ncbi:DUF3313 domain-containing protein [bacterium]|nr:DUF3313 domain-containing protein [bacterium]